MQGNTSTHHTRIVHKEVKQAKSNLNRHDMIEKMNTASNETKVNRDVTIPERNRGFIAQEQLGHRPSHRRLAVVTATTPEIKLV